MLTRALGLTCLAAAVWIAVPGFAADAPWAAWKHAGTLMLLTTAEGAPLAAGESVEEFPVLIRLHRDWFDFAQAQPDGRDIRFASPDGAALPYQVEAWDAAGGQATLWVRVPRIEGNSRQALRVYWGNPNAPSESSGKAVFSETNGYLSVWHMSDPVRDATERLSCQDAGTKAAEGVIGPARRFAGDRGISCGERIEGFPTGDAPHTTEAWFRAERSPAALIGWGNEKGQGKVVMQLRGPPHIRMDCYFSGADVRSTGLLAMHEWTHVAHVCRKGDSRLYVNGVLAGASTTPNSPLNLKSPVGLWLGNWHGGQHFTGELDEMRVSHVARSAAWLRLQYENQKPLQTLVGPLVGAGEEFAVAAEPSVVPEGGRARCVVKAGGAEKIYWSLLREGREQVLAVDRLAFDFSPERIAGDSTVTLRVKAAFPDGPRTKDILLQVKEALPDPQFTLEAPASWDGRSPLEIAPHLSNLASLEAAGVGKVRTVWSVEPFAVIQETADGKLKLLRAQKSGSLTITAKLDNGGRAISQSKTVNVVEPPRDAWVQRAAERDEKPEEGQFYARDDRNEGALHYNGALSEAADSVFLRVFADDRPYANESQKLGSDLSYAFQVKLKPGLVKYRVEFGVRRGAEETVLDRAGDLVCGDAFLIEGQSNAVATDIPNDTPRDTSDWIRTYSGPAGGDDGNAWFRDHAKKTGGKRANLWRRAVWSRKPPEHDAFIGWWGVQLARGLVESQRVPIFILNGAQGGTRIDQHQRNPANPTDLATIYGRMLWRLQQARLTHGIRGVIWHQGENDQPADGPSGEHGWVNYHRYFMEMAAGWKRDFPNVQHYYVFQIWPNSCAMGGAEGAGDRLREQQRTLSDRFSNLSVIATLGIQPAGGCHFPREGYDQFARLLQPLIERDHYGVKPARSITSPSLRRVAFVDERRDSLVLEFDQPVAWSDKLASQFYLDGAGGKISGGKSAGATITLQMKEPATGKRLTYLKEIAWSQDALLTGENGLAALTFCDVPIQDPR